MERTTLNELARMRKLAGLTESVGYDDGDGIDGMDAVSVAADAAATNGKPAPSAEEIAQQVAAFMAAFEVLKDNGAFPPEVQDAIDGHHSSLEEGIEQKIKKAGKTLCTAAMWLGLYNLGGPLLDATGLPFPDLSHISYELLGMVSPDSGVEQGYIGSQY